VKHKEREFLKDYFVRNHFRGIHSIFLINRL